MSRTAAAQTDEIQVYTGEILAPGAPSLTVHSNYSAKGLTIPAFLGGVVTDRSVNGAFEWGRHLPSAHRAESSSEASRRDPDNWHLR